ncbi:MAG: hypothetical protein IJH38_05415 [Clostridia bacterium]|nr:hypothetical protein [Clostridia bacterium]
MYNLHLRVETITDAKMRSELLASSSSGKNEAARTLMGRLREFFFRNVDEEIANYRPPYLAVGIANPTLTSYTDWEWTLTRYQDAVSAGAKDNDREALDAWDELEKSVVSHVADDVKVSIKGWTTEMIIEKKLG